jgi:hypothetical protein
MGGSQRGNLKSAMKLLFAAPLRIGVTGPPPLSTPAVFLIDPQKQTPAFPFRKAGVCYAPERINPLFNFLLGFWLGRLFDLRAQFRFN